ncbi:FHA domain-containing protein [Gulosibacter macacae]|uniref:FHA domain-containing protein n=1 Tax=Gulosibacter macacae TaxID=2488791 RepID=A0A3P3VVP6_9MICO|nr:FHA domain-containing protein [Gulosibacter macacae]RRJ86750.1 FHA domain-containing protein [Gulosibacter macacae]
MSSQPLHAPDDFVVNPAGLITVDATGDTCLGPRPVTEPVTTTHGNYGSGCPRLVSIAAGTQGVNRGAEFPLFTALTTIGSAPDSSIRLDCLEPTHAEIRHTNDDEYILVLYGPAETSGGTNAVFEDGAEGRILRTAYQVRLGEHGHQLVFERDESSDHGRPYGGREGGEGSQQRLQPERSSGERPAAWNYSIKHEP